MAPASAQPVAASTAQPTAMEFAPRKSNKGLIFGGVGLVAVAAAAFAFLGGGGTGKLIVTVAGPGGKAVSGVQVLIDGQPVCSESPCIRPELEPGVRIVSVKADGYEPTAGKSVKVEAGEETPLDIELTPTAPTGIKVTAEGAGLKLSIDGKEVGPLPQEVAELEAGEHTVAITGSDYFSKFEKKVTVKAGEMLELDPKLELVKGGLTVELGENAQGANVMLEGAGKPKPLNKHIGVTIELPTDKKYKLVATKKGFEDYEEEISFEDGKPEKTFTISLTPEGDADSGSSAKSTPGSSSHGSAPSTSSGSSAPSSQATLNINSIPVSNVIVDGRPLGTTPKVGVKVSPGSHTVVFVHPQHGRKVRTVNVDAGKAATAAVRFP